MTQQRDMGLKSQRMDNILIGHTTLVGRYDASYENDFTNYTVTGSTYATANPPVRLTSCSR